MPLGSPVATRLGSALVLAASHALDAARAWPVSSQQQARRNAMIAATACAQRRAEHEAVEDFLSAGGSDPAERTTPGPEETPGLSEAVRRAQG